MAEKGTAMKTRELEQNITPIIKQLKNLNIVIIESDLSRRRQIERMLDKYGFYKRSFYNTTRNALDAIMTGSVYDLVLLDWNITGEPDAKEFCKKVRQLGASMPLIFITSSSMLDYYAAFEAGATNIIKTPFDEDDFLCAVWSAMDIEAFRRDYRIKDLASFRKRLFFRLQQYTAANNPLWHKNFSY